MTGRNWEDDEDQHQRPVRAEIFETYRLCICGNVKAGYRTYIQDKTREKPFLRAHYIANAKHQQGLANLPGLSDLSFHYQYCSLFMVR